MIDIVIDTCTLKHAADPTSSYFDDSLEFISRMLKNAVRCIVDEGFSMDEAENASYIGLEYIKHLQPGSPGYGLIFHLATNDRIGFVSNILPQKAKKRIEQLIRNKKDRMFLRVTHNSAEKILASHDFTDYQIQKRVRIRKEFQITIVTAKEINGSL